MKIELVDIARDGIRPFLNNEDCGRCRECLGVCPGLSLVHDNERNPRESESSMSRQWGPVIEVWEGHASDEEIRYRGSSGGMATALALYCLEREGMGGVLHIGSDESVPHRNKTYFSQSREEVLSRIGSRYSPASPCDGLGFIEGAAAPSVFIGKPCDAAGVRMARSKRERLKGRVGLIIGIFCAGTPSTMGTLDLLTSMRIKPEEVKELSYRGMGWPGEWNVRAKGSESPSCQLTYKESWGFLQKYRPYRCYLCPDGTGEFADLSCGDAWYRLISREESRHGYSLIVVRTGQGRRIFRNALETGYVKAWRVSTETLMQSQSNLFAKRSAVWGRLLGLRAFAIPTPRLTGFSLFRNWLAIPASEKARSIGGTVRRIVARKYYRDVSYPALTGGGAGTL